MSVPWFSRCFLVPGAPWHLTHPRHLLPPGCSLPSAPDPAPLDSLGSPSCSLCFRFCLVGCSKQYPLHPHHPLLPTGLGWFTDPAPCFPPLPAPWALVSLIVLFVYSFNVVPITFIFVFKNFFFFFAILDGIWNLSSLTRNRTCAPALEARSLIHWTMREVPVSLIVLGLFFFKSDIQHIFLVALRDLHCDLGL